MAEYEHVAHTFSPVVREDARILILGSLPSVQSREQGFYYGHPKNRFWKVVAALYSEELPNSIQEKKELLYQRQIALYDVIESCDIIGSSDSSIKNVQPMAFESISKTASIQKIYANGALAGKLYRKYSQEKTGMEITVLPSTSPANAAFTLAKLLDAWHVITT